VYAIDTSPDISAIDRFGDCELFNLHVTSPPSTSSRLKAFFLLAINNLAQFLGTCYAHRDEAFAFATSVF
jgi:hypothetical protein